MTGTVVVLAVILAILAPVVLYFLVRAEHDDRDRMSRQDAEQAARRDTRENK